MQLPSAPVRNSTSHHTAKRESNTPDQQHGDHNDEHRRHREEYPARIVNIVKQAGTPRRSCGY